MDPEPHQLILSRLPGAAVAGVPDRLHGHHALYWVADFATDQLTCGVSGGSSNQSSTTSAVGLLTKGTYHLGVHWTWSGRQPIARCHITGPGIAGGYREISFAPFTTLGEAQMSHVELTSGLATEAVQVSARPQTLTRADFEPA